MLARRDDQDARAILESIGVEKVDGIVVDLGLSSDQLDDPLREVSVSRSRRVR